MASIVGVLLVSPSNGLARYDREAGRYVICIIVIRLQLTACYCVHNAMYGVYCYIVTSYCVHNTM